MNNWQKDKLNIPFASRGELVLIIALGCVNIALVALISSLFTIDAIFVAIVVAVLYLAEIALIEAKRSADATVIPGKNIHALLNEEGSMVIKSMASPVIAFDYYGTVLWYNDAMRTVIGQDVNFIGTDIGNIIISVNIKLFQIHQLCKSRNIGYISISKIQSLNIVNIT